MLKAKNFVEQIDFQHKFYKKNLLEEEYLAMEMELHPINV
jgi:hypothetical protein